MNRGSTRVSVPGSFAFLLSFAAFPAAQVAADAVEEALRVERATIQTLQLPEDVGRPFQVEVLLEGRPRVLFLTPHSMRADGFVLLVQGSDGSLAPREPAPPATCRGTVRDVPGSVVAASLFDGGLTATVRLAPGAKPWCVVPLATLGSSAPAAAHAVYDSALVRPAAGECLVLEAPRGRRAPPSQPAPGPGGGQKLCELAVDCDTQFYAYHGFSEAATQADVESILNANEAVYEADVGITYVLTTIIVRTFEPDPYSSFDMGFLLSQFVGEWTTTQAGVPRDAAQLFTGKDTGSVLGVAYLDSICDFGTQYSVVASSFSTDFASRVGLTAHELGHNWSAGHCDGDTDCKIMCGLFGGCAGDLTSFGTQSLNAIEAAKPTYACLADVTPACGFSTYGEALLNPTTLSAAGPGGIGSSFTLTYSTPATAPSDAFTVIAADQGSTAFGPGILLFDRVSMLQVTPGVHFDSTGDTPSETLSVPNDPALVGTDVFFQALHFPGPFAGPSGITEMSNGVRLEVCP